MADVENIWNLQIKIDGKPGHLAFTKNTFSVLQSPTPKAIKPTLQTSLQHVLWAETSKDDGNVVRVSTLAHKKKHLVLVTVTAHVAATDAEAEEWVRNINEMAYDGVAPRRRLKVLVNPGGGPGKAKTIFQTRAKPIFDAAHCTVDVEYTTHHLHAQEIAKTLPLEFDAIVTVSGDGLPHEVINGLAQRSDAGEALRTIPIVPIPAGSGNGFSLNLLGLKDGFDVALACLNVIKGRPMRLDLCSLTQGDRRTFSFFSQALGLMADLDLGTEGLRWMGDTRFIVGYLRGILKSTPVPVKLSIKSIDGDKESMLAKYKAELSDPPPTAIASIPNAGEGLPDVKYATEVTDAANGWVTFDKPMLYIYGGKQPLVARDFMQFPLAKASDGTVDIAIQEIVARGIMLNAMDGAEHGKVFDLPSQHYFKATAYRIEPLPGSKGRISMDGEVFPWAATHVEVHQALGVTLSIYGQFVNDYGKDKDGASSSSKH